MLEVPRKWYLDIAKEVQTVKERFVLEFLLPFHEKILLSGKKHQNFFFFLAM